MVPLSMNYAREAFEIDHEKSGHLTFDWQVNKLIVLTDNKVQEKKVKAILSEVIIIFIVEDPPRTRLIGCRMKGKSSLVHQEHAKRSTSFYI